MDLPHKLQRAYSLVLSKEDVEVRFGGIECMRKNGEFEYSVHKVLLDDGTIRYAFVSYDEYESVLDTWFVTKIPSKQSFKKIKKDKTSFEQIKRIDPDTILFESDSNTPITCHRFSDGTMMIIEYRNINEKFIVDDYYIEKDPVDIVNRLLPDDLKLIKE